jgi:hypothetical protein
MSDMYEIQVFENHMAIADDFVNGNSAIDRFVGACYKHVNPDIVPRGSARFTTGRLFVSYSDSSGCYNPKMVQMMGKISPEMISDIRDRMKLLYDNKCAACGIKVPFVNILCDDPDCTYVSLY